MSREPDERQVAMQLAHQRRTRPAPLAAPRKRRSRIERAWLRLKALFLRRPR